LDQLIIFRSLVRLFIDLLIMSSAAEMMHILSIAVCCTVE